MGSQSTSGLKAADKQRCGALRSAASNNSQLMQLADRKAQILVQVSALMISVLLTFALQIPEKHRIVIVPIAAQIIACLVVIMTSLAVTRPKLGGALHETSFYSGADSNLLFFETAVGMDEEVYVREMETMLGDSDHIIKHLIWESYHQALVLGKKYKYLRLAYISFSVGITISIVTSIIIALT